MALLEVKSLRTSFFTDDGEVRAVDGVSFSVEPGKLMRDRLNPSNKG